MSKRWYANRPQATDGEGQLDPQILPKSVVLVRLNRIMEAGLRYHEFLWFGPRDKVRKYLRENPDEARYKFASFSKFFDKAMPTKIIHQSDPNKKISADDIAEMKLTPQELRKLAGIGFPHDKS